jgi:hypothetical protein
MTTTTMTTTDRKPPRRRWPKEAVRTVAWLTGAVTFVASVAAIAAAPKPVVDTASQDTSASRPIIERRVLRRIVLIQSPTRSAPVTVAPSSSSGAAAPAPLPAPATSTGAS